MWLVGRRRPRHTSPLPPPSLCAVRGYTCMWLVARKEAQAHLYYVRGQGRAARLRRTPPSPSPSFPSPSPSPFPGTI